MSDYIRGGSIGLTVFFLAGHTHPAIIAGFFILNLINLALITSYFVRYIINK